MYNAVLINGTHKAPSIKVAEASKIIENSQRDVNIAFMNELAKIFNAMGIDTHDVIEAAASKWNFIKLNPGLVGGHCISVDPYYLIQKAQVYGVLPRIMFSARRLNCLLYTSILPLSQQMALVCHFIGLMFGGCDLLSVENPIGICQDCLYFD